MSKHVYSIRPGRDWVYCERCGAVNADKETECRGVLPTVATREPLWPVGSLQWAIEKANGGRFRRKSEPDYQLLLHGVRILFGSSKFRYDLSADDLTALDWEVCDGPI